MATEAGPFVLDLASNPHPLMLANALKARTKARRTETDVDMAYWRGYLYAMSDATGCHLEDLNAWLDSHET